MEDKNNPNYIETDDWFSEQFIEMRRLREENEKLIQTLENIIQIGYNEDCLFCGFKDKYAYNILGKELPHD
jgi:hypothetical protein